MADTNGNRPLTKRVGEAVQGEIGAYIRTAMGGAILTLLGIAWNDIHDSVATVTAKVETIAIMQTNQGAQIAVIQAERTKGSADYQQFKEDVKTSVRTNNEAIFTIGRAQAADDQRDNDQGRRLDRLEQRR